MTFAYAIILATIRSVGHHLCNLAKLLRDLSLVRGTEVKCLSPSIPGRRHDPVNVLAPVKIRFESGENNHNAKCIKPYRVVGRRRGVARRRRCRRGGGHHHSARDWRAPRYKPARGGRLLGAYHLFTDGTGYFFASLRGVEAGTIVE